MSNRIGPIISLLDYVGALTAILTVILSNQLANGLVQVVNSIDLLFRYVFFIIL